MEDALRSALEPRYEIRGLRGTGAMGRVYEAWDRKHGRRVAVKVSQRPHDPEGAERFRSEIQVLARLRHPAIVSVFDSGEVAGLQYFIMPFLEADSLRQRLDEGPLATPDLLRILDDVAGALDHAHDRGVVHRDVKPENVLLESGRALLTDFGIARRLDPERRGEEGAGSLGTLPYMSPEQILQPQAVGPSSDIYALGCLAFEALTGRLPFRASTRGGVVGRKIQGGEALGAGLAGLDRSVRAALTRAVDPDPSLRHPRASDLVAELRRAVGKRPRRLARFALTAAVAMLAVTAWTVWPRAPALDPERVVVGPVVNETGNPELDPLASSVVDYLTRGIQGTGLVRVIPTETALSSAHYALSGRSTGDPVAALAEETGAGVVVSGRIFRGGEEIGLSLQINDAIHGVVQSALEPVFRPPQEAGLLGLLEEAGDRLFGSLALILDERVEAFADAADPPPFRVYRMFSEGLDRYLAGDWGAAAELFLEAHRADASFVTPVLYAALSHSNMGAFAVEDSLLRAASGDPWSLTPFEWGWIQYRLAFLAGDRAAALQAIRAVAAAAPGSKAVYNYGVEAMEGRRLREAVDALESLPPDRGPVRGSVGHLGALAVSHHALGDEDQARRAASGLQEIHPDLLLPRQLACGPLAASDRLDILHAELDRVAAQGTDATGLTPGEVLVDCALELRAHGHPEASRSAVAQALAWFEERGWQELPDRALIAAGDAFGLLGRWDRAADVGARVLERQATGRIRLDALALVGRAAAARGDVATAEDIRDRLAGADGAFRFGYHLYAASLVEASLGRTAAALALLRRAFAEGLHFGAYLHLHPALDPLRREPGFQRLIEPVA